MATIIPFDSAKRATRRALPGETLGKEQSGRILLFTGVRYERPEVDPKSSGSGRPRAPRRRSRRG